MGTTYSIKIADKIDRKKIKDLNLKINFLLININNLFSTYIPNSEISKFNKSINSFKMTDEFSNLYKLSEEIYQNTNGAYDPTIHPLVKLWGFGSEGRIDSLPNDLNIKNIKSSIGLNKISINKNNLLKSNPHIELDFSAIAKGYGVDAVSQFLINNRIINFMVEIGGEIYCNGTKYEEHWQIGLQNPFSNSNNDDVLKIINLKNNAMATSGNYRNYFEFNGEKYSHTINPDTGYPVNHNVVSVTIISDNCAIADGYATAMMVLGQNDGLRIIEERENLEAIFVVGSSDQYQIIQSTGIKKFTGDL